MKKIKHRAIWADLESTGLLGRALAREPNDPGSLYGGGQILEVALAVVDDRPSGDMCIVDSIEVVLHFDVATGPMLHPSVIAMHTKNGLFAKCAASNISTRKADKMLYRWTQKVTGLTEPKGLKLAGNSVHFDHTWLRELMPKFGSCLHHRIMDITSLQEAAEAWLPDYEPMRAGGHRALADIESSIEAVRHWRAAVGL